MFVIIT